MFWGYFSALANPGLFEPFFVYNENWKNIIGFFEFDETVDAKTH